MREVNVGEIWQTTLENIYDKKWDNRWIQSKELVVMVTGIKLTSGNFEEEIDLVYTGNGSNYTLDEFLDKFTKIID